HAAAGWRGSGFGGVEVELQWALIGEEAGKMPVKSRERGTGAPHPSPASHGPLTGLLPASMQYPQQPRVRAPPEEALGVGRGDRDAGLLAAPPCAGGHVLLERAVRPLAGVVLHLQHDLLPRADVGDAALRAHAVDLRVRRVSRARAHALQLCEQRAEQLEL